MSFCRLAIQSLIIGVVATLVLALVGPLAAAWSRHRTVSFVDRDQNLRWDAKCGIIYESVSVELPRSYTLSPRPGYMRYMAIRFPRSPLPDRAAAVPIRYLGSLNEPEAFVESDPSTKARNPHRIGYLSVGWPFRAASLTWIHNHTSGRLVVTDGWIVRHPGLGESFDALIALPCKPMWAGIISDVLLWSLAAAASILTMRGIRQTMRRRAGRCPLCAYSLCGSMEIRCPECGWGRKSVGN